MTTLKYNIPAVHCDHCSMTIEREVGELEGVGAVSVNVDARTAEISFEPPASEDGIKALLTEIGYPPEQLITL
ncbi:MAG: heavy-metal-associated domain-containing protein [Anaerolineales bacterium]